MTDAFINIIRRISNLITIKSIVTLVLTVVFAILSLRNIITPEVFIAVFNIVIGFYFGTQKLDDTNSISTDNNLSDGLGADE